MPKLFTVFPEGFWSGNLDKLQVSRRWALPGVTCSLCGETWASIGIAYPSADLSGLVNERKYRTSWPVSVEELKERIQPLRTLIADEFALRPGAELGPLEGTGRGTFDDFVWLNAWTLLAKPEALDRLRIVGVNLPPAVPALIKFRSPDTRTLLELELAPRSLVAASSVPEQALSRCPGCGRIPVKVPTKIVIQKSSIPTDVDIFRDQILTTVILAKDNFVDAVDSNNLTGLQFEEVELA